MFSMTKGSLSHLLDQQDLKHQPSELRQICESLFSRGKGLRSRLVCLLGSFLDLSEEENYFLSRIVEYVHNSSLLHDDFIDHSQTRRNQKAAWLEFSPSQAVLVGDYLLARANMYLVDYLSRGGNLLLVHNTAHAICELVRGEFLQRELIPFQNKDLEKRNQVSELKTGSLFKWCLKAPFIYKKRENPELLQILDVIGFHMGLLFQRSDDLIDFSVRNKDRKACLTDIGQKHFNSFACFLLEGEGAKKEEAFKEIETLLDFSSLFPDWEDRLKAFDKLNLRLIEQTQEKLSELKMFLKPGEEKLISKLQEWTELIYWRDSKKRA